MHRRHICAAPAVFLILIALAGCGSTSILTVIATPTTTATPAQPSTAPSPTAAFSAEAATPAPATPAPAAAVTTAGLKQVSGKLYPGHGMTCFRGESSFATCPITPRLRTALQADLAHQKGSIGGYDPVCLCQNVDPDIAFTYNLIPPDGIIHASTFNGSGRNDYVVVNQGGNALADDIIYCSDPKPHSIDTGEPAHC